MRNTHLDSKLMSHPRVRFGCMLLGFSAIAVPFCLFPRSILVSGYLDQDRPPWWWLQCGHGGRPTMLPHASYLLAGDEWLPSSIPLARLRWRLTTVIAVVAASLSPLVARSHSAASLSPARSLFGPRPGWWRASRSPPPPAATPLLRPSLLPGPWV